MALAQSLCDSLSDESRGQSQSEWVNELPNQNLASQLREKFRKRRHGGTRFGSKLAGVLKTRDQSAIRAGFLGEN